MIIDLRFNVVECIPRLIWQQLFNFYRNNGGNLDRLDNLLIDYENCKKYFDDILFKKDKIKFILAIHLKTGSTSWIEEKSFWPNIKDIKEAMFYDHYLLCTITRDKFEYEIL